MAKVDFLRPWAAFVAAICFAAAIPDAAGQEAYGAVEGIPAEVLQNMSPEQRQQFMEARARGRGGPNQPGPNGQPPPNGEQPDGANGEAKPEEQAEESSDVVKREPAGTPGDAQELEIKPDEDGKVSFNFHDQPWERVLEWLASSSDYSLDWRELPSDAVNLKTPRPLTLEQARDLLNMQLMQRGFTMLVNSGVLSVHKLEGINTGLVPRVAPDALGERGENEVVKVSFPLDWMLAEQAVTEITPMLSPGFGKATALKTTNRIEVLDVVRNLKDIGRLLSEEQSDRGKDRLVKPFPLRHRRASDVVTVLNRLLGQKEEPAAIANDPNMMQQRMQMEMQRMQMRQQQQQQGGTPPPDDESPVYLYADERDNVVYVNAPADKMAFVEHTIEKLDTAPIHDVGFANRMGRLQTYRLAALDPETLVQTLQEVGNLAPTTRVYSDSKNKAVIVDGGIEDQAKVAQLIKKLDGSGRSFEVVTLRRLDADLVAGSIRFLMGEKNEDDNNQRNRYYGYYYGYGRQEEQGDSDEFRVEADVEYNRLWLWANEIELASVNDLLIKLGEVPAENSMAQTMRVIDVGPGDETDQLLERLKQLWPGMSPNELLIDEGVSEGEEEAEEDSTTQARANEELREARWAPPAKRSAAFAAFEADAEPTDDAGSVPPGSATDVDVFELPEDPAAALEFFERLAAERERASGRDGPSSREEEEAAEEVAPPPIRISRGPNGLVFSCPDPAVLNMLEDVVAELQNQQQSEYKVYSFQFADAYYVKLNLEDFFEEEKEDNDPFRRYFFYDPFGSNDDEDPRASKRKEIKFIDDLDTNTLLVKNATASQLRQIEELIEIYDTPEPPDSQSIRRNKIVQVHYAKAAEVAEVVKEVYRDVLSEKDKALQDGDRGDRGGGSRGRSIFGFSDSAGQNKIPRFEGLLSIGVHAGSNTLVVSAPGFVMDQIDEIVRELDERARPSSNSVQVARVSSALQGASSREALIRALTNQQVAGQEGEQADQEEQQRQEQERQRREMMERGGRPEWRN